MPNSWNRIADRYAQVAGTLADVPYQKLKEPLWEALGDLKGKRVLDVGCGTGWLSEVIRECGRCAVGVDGSARLLEMGRSQFPELELIEHDLTTGLPALDGRFDVVLAQMVLMDFDPTDPVILAIAEVLRPGGVFVLTLPHPGFFGYPTDADEEGTRVRKVGCYLEEFRTSIETSDRPQSSSTRWKTKREREVMEQRGFPMHPGSDVIVDEAAPARAANAVGYSVIQIGKQGRWNRHGSCRRRARSGARVQKGKRAC